MESGLDFHTARALLEWQIEFGVSETMSDAPVNRFELAPPAPKAKPQAKVQSPNAQAPSSPNAQAPSSPKPVAVDAAVIATQIAQSAQTLEELRAGMAEFEHCELKRGARNLVFGEGTLQAPVMIIGEAPGREEDRSARPFVGPAGALLDKMLAAIDLNRTETVYVSNVLPWRPPQNRDPRPEEIAMMLPFLQRQIELVQPKALVLMGNIACDAMLGKRGISRLRGNWGTAVNLPILPMYHPAFLLREPGKKREAWADLLSLKAKLRELT